MQKQGKNKKYNKSIDKILAIIGCQREEIKRDGDSLFNCVAILLDEKGIIMMTSEQLRGAVVDFMLNNLNEFKHYLVTCDFPEQCKCELSNDTILKEMTRLRHRGRWQDRVMDFVPMSNVQHVTIQIFTHNNVRTIQCKIPEQSKATLLSALNIAFGQEHYDVVRYTAKFRENVKTFLNSQPLTAYSTPSPSRPCSAPSRPCSTPS